MSKQRSIIVIADSGAGKSTSLGAIPQLGHKGLNESETFLFKIRTRSLLLHANLERLSLSIAFLTKFRINF